MSLIESIFKLKWKDGIPDFKKTPVDLTDGGYSAYQCSPKHNGATKVTIIIKATPEETEELKSWIEYIGPYHQEGAE